MLKQRQRMIWYIAFALFPVFLIMVIRIAPFMGNSLVEGIENITYELDTQPFHFVFSEKTLPAILMGSLLYFLGFMIGISSMKNKRPGEEYGSARWESAGVITRKYSAKKADSSLTNSEIRKSKKEYKKGLRKTIFENAFDFHIGYFKDLMRAIDDYKDENIPILEQNIGISRDRCNSLFSHNVRTAIKTIQSNINTLILGGSGRGKSRSFIIPNIMQMNSSFVCTDPKGEILRKVGKLLKLFGYDVRVLDLKNHEKSHGYNPFPYFRKDDDILKFVNNMWEAMEDKRATKSDPVWPELAKAMLMSLMLFVFHYCPPSEQNMDMVIELSHLIDSDENRKTPTILDKLFAKIPKDDTAYGYYCEWNQTKGRTLASVKMTLSGKLSVFNLPSMRKLTYKDELNILDLATKKVALFMVIPDDDKSYNFLAGTLYTQIFQQLYDYADNVADGPLPQHVRFYMDEFANIALPDDYQKILSTARSRNMSFVIVLQDKQQIEAIFEKYYKTIYGNCSYYLFLGSQEYDTCKYYSELLGKETIIVESWTKNYGSHGGMSRQEQKTGRELMTPDEVRKISRRKCIIYIDGEYAVMDQKYDMTNHKFYRFISDGKREEINKYDWGADERSVGAYSLLNNDYFGDVYSVADLDDNRLGNILGVRDIDKIISPVDSYKAVC